QIKSRQCRADREILRVGLQASGQHSLGLRGIVRAEVEANERQGNIVVRGARCSQLGEQSGAISPAASLLVQLRRNQVVEYIPGIAVGESARFGETGVQAVDLRLNADQVALQRSIARIAIEGGLQHVPCLWELFCCLQQCQVTRQDEV